jgi:LysM repeat protein
MKTRRNLFLVSLAVVLLLSAFLVPAASASSLAGAGCPVVYYRVVRGDMLSTIAARYGVTVWQLQQWNGIRNIDKIYAGSVLVIYPSRCYVPRPPAPPKPIPPPHPPLPGPCAGPGGCSGVIVPLPCPGLCPVPQPLPVTPAVCTDQRAVITSPLQNQQVSGWVTVKGNALHENFQFYKLEYGAGANPTDWIWFFGGNFPIWQGTLGALNTTLLAPGTYTIRVTVVDRTSNYPPPCQVTVLVVR